MCLVTPQIALASMKNNLPDILCFKKYVGSLAQHMSKKKGKELALSNVKKQTKNVWSPEDHYYDDVDDPLSFNMDTIRTTIYFT